MSELEKKITLPAPTIRRMIRAAEFEVDRLKAIDPYSEHTLTMNAIEEAVDSVQGKDGEFASIPAITAARLEANATLIHSNTVQGLFSAKRHLFEELERRGLGDHTSYLDSTNNT